MPSGQWVAVLSDDCTCKARNYSDDDGWYITSIDPACPDHGWQERAR